MVRLGINTISELIRKTGDDLLECKNFGVTSLNEVREKLELMSLKLRGDDRKLRSTLGLTNGDMGEPFLLLAART